MANGSIRRPNLSKPVPQQAGESMMDSLLKIVIPAALGAMAVTGLGAAATALAAPAVAGGGAGAAGAGAAGLGAGGSVVPGLSGIPGLAGGTTLGSGGVLSAGGSVLPASLSYPAPSTLAGLVSPTATAAPGLAYSAPSSMAFGGAAGTGAGSSTYQALAKMFPTTAVPQQVGIAGAKAGVGAGLSEGFRQGLLERRAQQGRMRGTAVRGV